MRCLEELKHLTLILCASTFKRHDGNMFRSFLEEIAFYVFKILLASSGNMML